AQLPILMVWIYLSWCILFYAAGLSALVQGVPDKTGARGAAAGGWEPALMVDGLPRVTRHHTGAAVDPRGTRKKAGLSRRNPDRYN
ncbi:MAG: hypothetical protein QF774_11195, partial [Nitrospinota bacterium]|nr:hypothetical protein [Nitrospinota bacterium]